MLVKLLGTALEDSCRLSESTAVQPNYSRSCKTFALPYMTAANRFRTPCE